MTLLDHLNYVICSIHLAIFPAKFDKSSKTSAKFCLPVLNILDLSINNGISQSFLIISHYYQYII